MCGIWARTRFGEPIREEELLYPVKSLRHRGPDGYGWYLDEFAALAHTRLSIIDLAGGAQPLLSHDGNIIGIVNGELYEFEEIRSRLQNEGVAFKTHSDSEVLLNLFARRGAKALRGLSGEFAFLFYDRRKKLLHFGRDPFGVKPLFFSEKNGEFTLASEMKALDPAKPVFSETYVKTYLARLVVPPGTCLAGVEHVLPGRLYTLNLRSRSLHVELYEELPLFRERNEKTEDSIEELEFQLRASIKRRLRADVEVGCYLSGGIDSALIAAMAVDLGAKPQAFTVGFSDRDFDETSEAASIASDLGIRHSTATLTSKNIMGSLIGSIAAFENPVSNPHGAAKNLLASHARKHVKVVLSGEGADEWLGGYAYMRLKKVTAFSRRHPKFGLRLQEKFLAREGGMNVGHLDGASSHYDSLASSYFGNNSPSLLGRLAKDRFYEFVTGEKLGPLVGKICRGLSEQLLNEHPGRRDSELDLNLWVGARTDLLHYILANVGDRQEMAHSLEGRTPYLDTNLVKVAASAREASLIRGLREKFILREVGKKYLRATHHQRGKKPFFSPLKHLYLRKNAEIMNGYIEMSREETPWLNWKNIDHILKNPRRKFDTALEGNIITLRMALFSLGVLKAHLREPGSRVPGFVPPENARDLAGHRKVFPT